MEFTGRVKKILPLRSGISQRTGNEWQQLSFVFEYFEHDTDRFPDSVLLDTFDTKVIEHLKEGMELRIGFGMRARTFTKQNGTEMTINEPRIYKLESVKPKNEAPQASNAPQPNNNPPGFERPVTSPENGANQEGGKDDDLPF